MAEKMRFGRTVDEWWEEACKMQDERDELKAENATLRKYINEQSFECVRLRKALERIVAFDDPHSSLKKIAREALGPGSEGE